MALISGADVAGGRSSGGFFGNLFKRQYVPDSAKSSPSALEGYMSNLVSPSAGTVKGDTKKNASSGAVVYGPTIDTKASGSAPTNVSSGVGSARASSGVDPVGSVPVETVTQPESTMYIDVPRSVDTSSSSVSRYLNMINRNASQNSARSAREAQILREWQEQQNAKAMAYNSYEAGINRNWQEYMSNTAHQREVADLQAAGLNPVLSAMNGNGAAVTSGATAQGVTSSGAKGDVDTSANSAIVSLLGSFLNTQTELEMANVNAQTQRAVADKYNAMAYVTSMIGADASRYAASASAGATRYAADQSAAASRYASDTSKYIKEVDVNNPNTFAGIVRDWTKTVGSFLEGLFTGDYVYPYRWFK